MYADEFSMPVSKSRPGRVVAVVWAAAHAVAWLTLIQAFTVVVPKFGAIFTDFGVAVSRFHVGVIAAAVLLQTFKPLVLGLFIAGVVADVWWLDKLFADLKRQDRARRWAGWLVVIPGLSILALVVLMAPVFLSLVSKLSG